MTAGKQPGYHIPAEPEPATDVCIRVYVPNDIDYIGSFWAAYEHFTQWVAWERDAEHTGKTAAARWKTSFDKSRSEFECFAGECGIVDIRQSETEPCILEKQEECGDWEQFADLSLCKNDPLPAAQSDEWLELLDALMAWKSLFDLIDVMLDDGQSATTIKIALAPLTQHLPALPGLIDDMSAMNAEDRQAALDAVDWQSAALTIFCQTDCDLSDFANFPTFALWLICAMDAIKDWAQNEVGTLAGWTTDLLSGVTNAMGIGWITSSLPGQNANWQWGAPICADWFHVFDLKTENVWTISSYLGYLAGSWQSGVGVRGVYAGVLGSTGAYRVLMVSPVVSLTGMIAGGFMVSYDPEEDYYGYEKLSGWNSVGELVAWVNHPGVYNPPSEMWPDGWKEGEGSEQQCTRSVIQIGRIHYDESEPAQGAVGGIIVSKIVVWGTGNDPF